MNVINLMGEPGVGKSVTAAGIYYQMSIEGLKIEIVPEIAKGYAWETPKNKNGESLVHPVFSQQIFILGEQNRMLERIKGKRDFAIMECPLIMGAIYQPQGYFSHFTPLVLEQFNAYNNINVLLERQHRFDEMGRIHNEEQANQIKKDLILFLDQNKIPYVKFTTHKEIHLEITEYIKNKTKTDKK